MSLPDAGLPTSSCRNRRPSDRSHAPAPQRPASCRTPRIRDLQRLTHLYARSVFGGAELTRNDSAVLKALAILLIAAHNFFHQVKPFPGENEMAFGEATFRNTVEQIAANPLDAFHPLVSFFGHYGVHVFILLSGYGLMKKALGIASRQGGISTADLFRMAGNQIAKIMLLTVVGVSVLILYKLMAYGGLPDAEFFRKYLVFLTFTENLRPSDFGYFVTVWWFMALIVQCYLLFPFVYRLATGSAWGAAGVALLSMTGAYAFYQPLLDAGVLVYATPLGQLPLFLLGAWLAAGRRIPATVVFGLAAVLPLTFVDPEFFHLSFLSVVTVAFLLYGIFREKLSASRFLVWTGGLSMFIYIVHGDLRWLIIPIVNETQNVWFAYVAFFGFMTEVFLFALLARWISEKTRLFRLVPFRMKGGSQTQEAPSALPVRPALQGD